VDRLFKQAISTLGEISLFVANSGFAYYELIERPDWRRIESQFSACVNTKTLAQKSLEARLKSLKEAGKGDDDKEIMRCNNALRTLSGEEDINSLGNLILFLRFKK
jgi:hypothetical protein